MWTSTEGEQTPDAVVEQKVEMAAQRTRPGRMPHTEGLR